MTIVACLLLVAGIGTALRPVRSWPSWSGPVVLALLGVALGTTTPTAARDALRVLSGPLGFLLAIVPLAVMLDRFGFFEQLADLAVRRRRVVLGFWILSAVTTTLFNLDAAVVLLTPLAVRLARRLELNPLALAFAPALLACLASSALPISNLTNLIAMDRFGLTTADFLEHLALPTLAMTTVGWFAYRVHFRDELAERAPASSTTGDGVEPRVLVVGSTITIVLLTGLFVFTALGIPLWTMVLLVDGVLVVVLRQFPSHAVPFDTATLVIGLGVLAAGVAPHLPAHALVGGNNSHLHSLVAGALSANALNNLPALLVALPSLHATGNLWPFLLGVNAGPVFLVTGSLSGLLWLTACRRLGIEVSALDYSRVGLRVGLPAFVAGAAVLLLLS